jgi:heat shock protein HslJ
MKSKTFATMVVVILGAWLLPGCKLFTEEVPLPGTYWTLVALNSHELLPGSAITAAFKESEWITLYIFGTMGCNDYSSHVELDEEHSDALQLTRVGAATDRSCHPDLLEQEGEYLAALRNVRAYEISRNRLAMKNQPSQVVLEFRRDTVEGDDTLPGTRWNLETLNGHALIPDSRITANISEKAPGGIGGIAGCNSYGLLVELVDDQVVHLKYLDILAIVTDLGCAPKELMVQEREYLETLRSVTTYKVSDDRLELKNQAGEVVLVFHQDPTEIDLALLGRSWRLETLKGQALIPNSRITATFSETNVVSRFYVHGNAGCNPYSFPLELEKNQITHLTPSQDAGYRRISECAGLMEQEEEYIAALLSVASYEVSYERLELKNQAGEAVLVFRSGE